MVAFIVYKELLSSAMELHQGKLNSHVVSGTVGKTGVTFNATFNITLQHRTVGAGGLPWGLGGLGGGAASAEVRAGSGFARGRTTGTVASSALVQIMVGLAMGHRDGANLERGDGEFGGESPSRCKFGVSASLFWCKLGSCANLDLVHPCLGTNLDAV